MITAQEARQKAIERQAEISKEAQEQLHFVFEEINKAIRKGHLMCQVNQMLYSENKDALKERGYGVIVNNHGIKAHTGIYW